MSLITTADGKHYREVCPVCRSPHLYDRRQKGPVSDLERYRCPVCGYTGVAPLLEPVEMKAEPEKR